MPRKLRVAVLLLLVAPLAAMACAPAPSAPATGAAPPRGAAAAPAAAPPAVPAAPPPPAAAAPARERADDAPLQPPVTVKLAIFGTLGDAPLYIAQEKGYFQTQGLDIEAIPSDSAPRIIPFLAAGQVDVAGLSQSPALFNAVGRGVPIRIVADKGRVSAGHGYAALVVRKDVAERVRDYADLRGLRIATPGRGTAMWSALARALAAGGLGFADVELEELAQPDMLPALANGAIDAATLIEPFVNAAVANGAGVRWRGVDEFAPNATNGLIAYAPHFVQQQPEAARRFLVAYLHGLRDYLDAFDHHRDRDEIIDILVKHTPVKNRALYATMQPVGFEPNGLVNVDYLRAEQDLYAREGLLTDPADPGAFVDHQYAEYAITRLGRR